MILELPERRAEIAKVLQQKIAAKHFFKHPFEENVNNFRSLPRRIRIARESLGLIPVIQATGFNKRIILL